MESNNLQIVEKENKTERIESDFEVQLGQWYWIEILADLDDNKYKEYDSEIPNKFLYCVNHIGSNFVELVRPKNGEYGGDSHYRFHFNEFYESCTYEPNAEQIFREKVKEQQSKVKAIMGKIYKLSALLGVGFRQELNQGNETQALAIQSNAQPVKEYKEALILAKETTLPELFKEIKDENRKMKCWMMHELIPLQIEADQLKPVMKAIESRIFNIELYAGLVEEIKQIKEGLLK
jgi:hypothetical protein